MWNQFQSVISEIIIKKWQVERFVKTYSNNLCLIYKYEYIYVYYNVLLC